MANKKGNTKPDARHDHPAIRPVSEHPDQEGSHIDAGQSAPAWAEGVHLYPR